MSRISRPIISEAIYFITCVTYQRRPWFSNPSLAQIVVDQWRHYAEDYEFRLDAYCVLPDHYHVVLNTGMKKTISQILHAVNSYTVTLISDELGLTNKFKIWQGGSWDEVIRDEAMYWQKVAYTLQNPWREGLVSEPLEIYPYSNIRSWLERNGEEFLVDLFRKY